jgi:hypothetical protein
MKLCKDCKHCKHEPSEIIIPPNGYTYRSTEKWLCAIESKIDPIQGKPLPPYRSCHVEREDALRLEEFRCGKEGKYWEAK